MHLVVFEKDIFKVYFKFVPLQSLPHILPHEGELIEHFQSDAHVHRIHLLEIVRYIVQYFDTYFLVYSSHLFHVRNQE